MKRTFDILVAAAALFVLSPVLLLIALAVLAGSGRPVLFRQKRVGRNGFDFTIYKFRTMRVLRGTEAGSFDAGRTTRVTPVGRLLRRTKLDELPQLWNVLLGDMALVGPRPEIRRWVDAYPDRWARVLTVRPGITDPASIVYRNEESCLARATDPEAAYRREILPHKLALYERYVCNYTFLGDILILFKTVKAIAGR